MTDDSKENVKALLDSTAVVLLSRIVTTVLLPIVCFFVIASIQDTKTQLKDHGDRLSSIQSDVRDINTRFNSEYAAQIKANTQDLQDIHTRRDDWTRWRAVIDQRLDVIEGEPHRSMK